MDSNGSFRVRQRAASGVALGALDEALPPEPRRRIVPVGKDAHRYLAAHEFSGPVTSPPPRSCPQRGWMVSHLRSGRHFANDVAPERPARAPGKEAEGHENNQSADAAAQK